MHLREGALAHGCHGGLDTLVNPDRMSRCTYLALVGCKCFPGAQNPPQTNRQSRMLEHAMCVIQYGSRYRDKDVRLLLLRRAEVEAGQVRRRGGLPEDDALPAPATFSKLSRSLQDQIRKPLLYKPSLCCKYVIVALYWAPAPVSPHAESFSWQVLVHCIYIRCWGVFATAVDERSFALSRLLRPSSSNNGASGRGKSNSSWAVSSSPSSSAAAAWGGGLSRQAARQLLAAQPATLLVLDSASVAAILRGISLALRISVLHAAQIVSFAQPPLHLCLRPCMNAWFFAQIRTNCF